MRNDARRGRRKSSKSPSIRSRKHPQPKSPFARPRTHSSAPCPPPRPARPAAKPKASAPVPPAVERERLASQFKILANFTKDWDLFGLARQTRWCRRLPKKLTPLLFLQSTVLLLTRSSASLVAWASLAGLFGNLSLSKQALWERLRAPAVDFLAAVLARCLGQRLLDSAPASVPEALKAFGRVLIQDSTCLSLPSRLARFFPGSSNQRGTRRGQLKIQCTLDLLTHRFVAFALSSFRRNDQAAAHDILEVLRPGDLVLRDLGYFVPRSLRRIGEAGAFFLSRLRSDVRLEDPSTGRELDLLRALRRHGQLDCLVRLGCGGCSWTLRLVALPLPPEVAAERRRKARRNRDRRCNPRERTLALMGWSIFVTNVPARQMSARTVAQVYGLRWRVETLFKAWKSGLHLERVPGGGRYALEAAIYGQLILISILALLWPMDERASGSFSLIRFVGLVADNLFALISCVAQSDFWQRFAIQVQTHARYDSRRRPNFMEIFAGLS